MGMKRIVQDFLASLSLSPTDILLVAVSGGRDSMVLLHLLGEIAQETASFTLAVAHFHHQTRGEESTQDQDFVCKFWEEEVLFLPFRSAHPHCYVGTAPIATLAKQRKQCFEETAREERYRFFRQVQEEIGAKYIATAHHSQDNLETFLLHLCRGTGGRGLSAIAPLSQGLIRPLLSVSPKDLEEYVGEHGLSYREDSSNREEIYRRNFLRHQVLGKLEDVNSQYLEHSANTIRIIREENNFLDRLVAEQLPLKKTATGVSCRREDFLALDSALYGRALHYLLQSYAPTESLNQKQIAAAVAMAKNSKPWMEIFLHPLLHLRRSYDTIICGTFFPREHWGDHHPLQDETQWHGWRILAKEVIYGGGTLDPWSGFYLPYVEGISVRGRQQGDTLALVGRRTKTLKKWCIQEKIPQDIRDYLPVFVSPEETILAMTAVGCGFAPTIGEKVWQITLDGHGFLERNEEEKNESI